MAFILYSLLTKKGKLFSVKMITGAKNIELVGELSDPQIVRSKLGLGFKQTLKVYKCSTDVENYYVLESTDSHGGGFNRHYIILKPDTIAQLESLLNR
jgi:hypothetical protein